MDEDSDTARLVEEGGSTTADGPVSEESSELHLPKVSYPLLRIPWGVMVLEKMGLCHCGGKVKWRRRMYQGIVLVLTFQVYMSYHLSRVSVGVVKSTLLPPCRQANPDEGVCGLSTNNSNETCPEGWEPFVGHNGSSVNGATRLGGVDTAFLITYALTMFASGIIAERTPLRYFLSIGMLGAAVCTGLLGFAFFWRVHHLWYFILVQIAGGVFQSTGWPALVAVMGNWFGKSRRGFIMGIWNWHTSVGNLLGYLIPAIWARPDTWGWSFLSAAFIMLSINILFFLFLPSEPGVVGLKSPTQNSNDKKDEINSKREQVDSPLVSADREEETRNLIPNESVELTTTEESTDQGASKKKKAIPFWKALAIPGVVEYSVALFFSKLVSYTFLFWLPFYINNERIGGQCLNPFESALFASLFDIGAMIGSVLIGTVSDVIHSRSISCMLFFVLAVPALFVYRSFGSNSIAVSGILIVFVGIFVNGPYAIITTAVSADLGTHKKLKGEKKAVATITAVIDGTGSIGAAVGPFLTGWIDDQFGWTSVFYFLMVCCSLASLFIIRIIIFDIIKGLKFFRKKWRLYRGLLPENVSLENPGEENSDGSVSRRTSMSTTNIDDTERKLNLANQPNGSRRLYKRAKSYSVSDGSALYTLSDGGAIGRSRKDPGEFHSDRLGLPLRRASDAGIPIRRISIQDMPCRNRRTSETASSHPTSLEQSVAASDMLRPRKSLQKRRRKSSTRQEYTRSSEKRRGSNFEKESSEQEESLL